MPSARIRLDELLARDISIAWVEAVAVVQTVCQMLLSEREGEPDAFPTVASVEIREDGSIGILARARCTDPAARASVLLGTMLEADAPAPLSALVTQAAAGRPELATLAQFEQGLSYFARPQGEKLIADLCSRGITASYRAEPRLIRSFEPKKPAIVTPAKPQMPLRALVGLAVAVTLVLVAIAGAFWLQSHPDDVAEWRSQANAMAARVSSVTLDVVDSVSQAVGGSSARPASASAPARPATETVTATPAPSSSRRAPETRTRPATSGRSSSTAPRTRSSPPLPGTAAPAGNVAADPGPAPNLADDSVVYTVDNTDVSPPRPVSPALDLAERGEGHARLELVVNADGTVDSVRLLTPPRSVKDGLLISAAKTWKFAPARREGQPVRYRYQIAVP